MHRHPYRFKTATVGLLVAFLMACAGRGGEESSSPERRFLSIGTAPPGGAFFPVGGALAEALNVAKADDGWQVTAEATKGTQENIRRLGTGELDLGMANSAISYFAVRGEAGWDQAHDIRVVMTLAPNVAFFVTPTDSGIESIADLRGQRVVLGPAGAGFEFFLGPILDAYELGYEDLQALNDTQAGAVSLLADGSAAAAFLGGAIPTAAITQAATSQDVRFVPFDQDVVDRLVETYAFFDRATVPAGAYPGQDEDFHGMNVGSMHLVASTSTDEDLIYEITRALWENREGVAARHPAGKAINPKVAIRDTGPPFHPGSVRFYREIGIWPE